MDTQVQRGTIIQVPMGAEPGLLFVGGAQKNFRLAGIWQAATAPVANQTVDVTLDAAGEPARITTVDTQTLAKEKLDQLAGKSAEQSQVALAAGLTGFHSVRHRMGTVLLVAAVILFIAWFFLPAVSVNLGFGASKDFTVSSVLGLDLSGGAPTGGFGFWSFLGLVAVLLPWAVPWLKARWAPLLLCAPLLMAIVAFIRIRLEIHHVASVAVSQAEQMGGAGAGAMVQGIMDQMSSRLAQAISYGVGLWIVVLVALLLAAIGVKRWLSAPQTASAT